ARPTCTRSESAGPASRRSPVPRPGTARRIGAARPPPRPPRLRISGRPMGATPPRAGTSPRTRRRGLRRGRRPDRARNPEREGTGRAGPPISIGWGTLRRVDNPAPADRLDAFAALLELAG